MTDIDQSVPMHTHDLDRIDRGDRVVLEYASRQDDARFPQSMTAHVVDIRDGRRYILTPERDDRTTVEVTIGGTVGDSPVAVHQGRVYGYLTGLILYPEGGDLFVRLRKGDHSDTLAVAQIKRNEHALSYFERSGSHACDRRPLARGSGSDA